MDDVWLDEIRAKDQVSAKLSPIISHVGKEKTPVIQIDDFLIDTHPLIDIAVNHAVFFTERKTAYPGVRTNLPDAYLKVVMDQLKNLMREVYAWPENFRMSQCYGSYSLVSTPESKLTVFQRVPHFDAKKPYFFALLLYLNSGQYGGTNFYRHNPTGFERISDENFPEYMKNVEQYFDTHGLPAANYYQEQDGHFSIIGSVEYKPNRLVIYPGNLLHSGDICNVKDIDPDPKSGRLTANIFVNFDCDV